MRRTYDTDGFRTRFWILRPLNSPSIATWGSLVVKLSSHAIVIPLALAKLPVEEVSLWLLLYSFIAIGLLADFGFAPTFIRFVAYASGEKPDPSQSDKNTRHDHLEDFRLGEIVRGMRFIYARLCAGCGVVMLLFGSIAVAHPISLVQQTHEAWIAWAFVILSTTAALYNSMYSAYLQGRNHIALLRRWEMVSGSVSIIAALICLSFDARLVFLVLALQLAPLMNVCVNRGLARRLDFNRVAATEKIVNIRSPVVHYVWRSAWRSGLGLSATIGAIQITNIFLAQFASPLVLAPYLLAQRLIAAVVSFSAAPFYTRIPQFVVFHKKLEIDRLKEDARKRFMATNWILVTGLAVLGPLATFGLAALNSETAFVTPVLWFVLSLAALFERTGAMHLQLYSLSNHIVWHVANGGTSLIIILSVIPMYSAFGVIGLGISSAVAYGLFYMPYCLRKSYTEYKIVIGDFEFYGAILPASLLILAFLWQI